MQNMMISSSLASSPKNVLSIQAFNLKKKFTANTLYMDFDQKIFPQKFLRSHHCRFFNKKMQNLCFPYENFENFEIWKSRDFS